MPRRRTAAPLPSSRATRRQLGALARRRAQPARKRVRAGAEYSAGTSGIAHVRASLPHHTIYMHFLAAHVRSWPIVQRNCNVLALHATAGWNIIHHRSHSRRMASPYAPTAPLDASAVRCRRNQPTAPQPTKSFRSARHTHLAGISEARYRVHSVVGDLHLLETSRADVRQHPVYRLVALTAAERSTAPPPSVRRRV